MFKVQVNMFINAKETKKNCGRVFSVSLVSSFIMDQFSFLSVV